MKLLTQQPQGTLAKFIEDRLGSNWRSPEQAEAMVHEYFYILAEIVCDPDSRFSDLARRTFPVLPKHVCLESCVLWLMLLTPWMFARTKDELGQLGRAKVTWE